MPQQIERKAARKTGSSRYFTGHPCPRGHIADRFVSTRACVRCVREKKKAALDPARERARARRLYRLNQAAIDAKNRQWAINNPEAVTRVKRRWHLENPMKVKESKQRWVRENPEKAREYFRRRHARLKGAPGSHTVEEAHAILVDQGFRCANPFCRADLRTHKRHLDHIRPLTPRDARAAPGANSADNLQWLCWPCNASKGNGNWEEWLAGYARLARGETEVKV